MELIRDTIQKFRDMLKNLPADNINHHNLFVYYESQITLKKFERFCNKYEKAQGFITKEFVSELESIVTNRWTNIARTPAAYNYYAANKVETNANLFCASIAKMFILMANTVDYKSRSEKEFMMPPLSQHLSVPLAYENLVKSVIKDLHENPDINQILAKEIDIDLKWVASRVQTIIDNVETVIVNQKENDDLFIALESKRTINKIKENLQKILNNDVAFSTDQLQTFVKLLEDRWNGIDGSSESYLINPNSKTNKICRSLANYLSLLCVRTNYLNKDPLNLMMPTPPKQIDQQTGYRNLQKFVCECVQDREALINEIRGYDYAKWKKYIGGFELKKLESLITNNQTMDKFFQAEDSYTEDEERSKALLFCVYEYYKKHRKLFPYHKTISGAMFQYVVKVYNIEDKLSATKATQQVIIALDDLIDFNNILNNPNAELFKHRGALLNSELRKFTDEIYKAIKQLPQKKNTSENENILTPIVNKM